MEQISVDLHVDLAVHGGRFWSRASTLAQRWRELMQVLLATSPISTPWASLIRTLFMMHMQKSTIGFTQKNTALYQWASVLAWITIVYNIGEGLVSVFFGLEDESLALFGFGLDSFVEVASGIGIWHMIGRIRKHGSEHLDRFEKAALKVTGSGFYVLTAGLAVIAVVNLYQGHKPETTFWGIVVSLISIATMWLLIHYKVKVGTALNSQAILSDAACTRACLQLSVVLLVASVGYKFTGFGGFDSVGTLIIAGLCWREGKEAFEKAKAGSFACACGGDCEK